MFSSCVWPRRDKEMVYVLDGVDKQPLREEPGIPPAWRTGMKTTPLNPNTFANANVPPPFYSVISAEEGGLHRPWCYNIRTPLRCC